MWDRYNKSLAHLAQRVVFDIPLELESELLNWAFRGRVNSFVLRKGPKAEAQVSEYKKYWYWKGKSHSYWFELPEDLWIALS